MQSDVGIRTEAPGEITMRPRRRKQTLSDELIGLMWIFIPVVLILLMAMFGGVFFLSVMVG